MKRLNTLVLYISFLILIISIVAGCGTGKISYNPEVPSYSAKYQLTNDDYNVKQLRKRYKIPTNKAPKLLLKGSGDLKGSSVGYKDIEFTFVEKKGENTFFTDSLHLEPSEDK
ncbi:Csa1 family protein [Staphylococcus aureus]|nr:Csa1 family protein [Staphylococcus aureus]